MRDGESTHGLIKLFFHKLGQHLRSLATPRPSLSSWPHPSTVGTAVRASPTISAPLSPVAVSHDVSSETDWRTKRMRNCSGSFLQSHDNDSATQNLCGHQTDHADPHCLHVEASASDPSHHQAPFDSCKEKSTFAPFCDQSGQHGCTANTAPGSG